MVPNAARPEPLPFSPDQISDPRPELSITHRRKQRKRRRVPHAGRKTASCSACWTHRNGKRWIVFLERLAPHTLVSVLSVPVLRRSSVPEGGCSCSNYIELRRETLRRASQTLANRPAASPHARSRSQSKPRRLPTKRRRQAARTGLSGSPRAPRPSATSLGRSHTPAIPRRRVVVHDCP
jgi:hypothetical protein